MDMHGICVLDKPAERKILPNFRVTVLAIRAEIQGQMSLCLYRHNCGWLV